jgi:hypothetical protein
LFVPVVYRPSVDASASGAFQAFYFVGLISQMNNSPTSIAIVAKDCSLSLFSMPRSFSAFGPIGFAHSDHNLPNDDERRMRA